MLWNFIVVATRSLLKNKISSFINITSLAIGMASCLLIIQYVNYELSYDKFHRKASDIYRIQYNNYQNGNVTFECAAAVPAVGPVLKNNFGEIKEYVRLFPVSGIMTYEDPDLGLISFREEKMQIVGPSVFKVFDFRLIEGDTATCLTGPNKAVISKRAAKKYFGVEDPINKEIDFDGNMEFIITGIMDDVPENSHIKFDFMLSYETLNRATENASETAWGWYDFNTYVLVNKGTDILQLQEKWDKLLIDLRGEEWDKYNYRQEFLFQPLKDIHLFSDLLQESEPQEQGDGNAVYFLTIIAFFILVIAWVNYINLTTAKSVERASEVGIRKVLGALRPQLIGQFLIESLLVNLIASLVSILIFTVSITYFNNLLGKEIPLSLFSQGWFWIGFVSLFLFGALLSGAYPALVITSHKPTEVIKGKYSTTKSGLVLRRGLVVFQFASSVFLITGTIIVYSQLEFMLGRDLGININETLVVRGPGITDSLYNETFITFKTELLRNSSIKSITAGTNVPGNEIFWTNGVKRIVGGPESSLTTYNVGIDYDYINAFELNVLAGRNFSADFPSDNKAVIFNKALFDALEFNSLEESINQKVIAGGDTMELVGIIDNYHQMSLKSSTSPILYRYIPASSSFFSFKIQSDKIQSILRSVNDQWKIYFPGNPMEYFFLDSFFNKQYKKDQQFGEVFSLFSLLTILVACLGLFGLASYTILQRTKEIGIRKVLGSSVSRIVVLFFIDFLKPILAAIIISVPITYMVMQNWLSGFPYRIDIQIQFFFISSGIILIISIITISVQTIKAALLNPANSIRYE